jgi:AcrR family transcriptional regulator
VGASDGFRARVDRYSAVQLKTIATALDLFADHGTGGTSFQMIADALGVTKGAVYHQFRTKEAIVIAAAEVQMARFEATLADAEGGTIRAREALLGRVIDVVVENRRAVGTLQNDPALVRFLNTDEESQKLWGRLFAALLGDALDVPGRVRAAVLSAAIGSVGHPFVANLDNETLRAELLQTTRRLIGPR